MDYDRAAEKFCRTYVFKKETTIWLGHRHISQIASVTETWAAGRPTVTGFGRPFVKVVASQLTALTT